MKLRTIVGMLVAAAMVRVGWGSAPKPLEPVPSAAQIAWIDNEFTFFIHFNMDTFTGKGIGDGDEDPKIFNPTELDCEQWAEVAKAVGSKGMILTAKHHDGFCIWPTATTEHSVKNSTWKDGKGDVVREFVEACHKNGIKVGIYCSPYDRSTKLYDADKPAYAKMYQAQLTELLSNYGPVYEMWFDGNKADVATWGDVVATVRKLQPDAVVKQGPRVTPIREDVRWVGNEMACAPLTNWSVEPAPSADGKEVESIWFARECDTLLNGHWFWDEKPPRDLATLLNYYYWSVGRNCQLILNVAPDTRGKFSDACVTRLKEFRAAIDKIFEKDLAAGKTATASNTRENDATYGPAMAVDGNKETYWATDDGVTSASLEIDLGAAADFNVIRTEEVIALGQRVSEYKIEALEGADWKTIVNGTTIGNRKLDRFPKVTASKIRLTIEKARACPTIRTVGVYLDTVSPAESFEPAIALKEMKPGTRAPKGN